MPLPSKAERPPEKNHSNHGKQSLKEAGLSICKANVCLAEGSYVQALDLYTSVLVSTVPGHPCASWGRTLCYLVLGYPSLAGMEAWRTLNAANLALEDPPSSPWMRPIMKIMKITDQQTSAGAIWTSSPTCFVESRRLPLLNLDLASINISRGTLSGDRVEEYTYFCQTIILKAYYLLALSLYQLGGGALRSAMEMLADAREMSFCKQDDADQFTAIESEVYSTVRQQMDREKATVNTPSMIQSLMDLRYTRVPRHLYPWDTYCTGGSDLRVADRLNRALQEQFETPAMKISSSTESGHAFSLRVQAREGVIEDQDIFQESTTLQVCSTDCKFFTYDGMFCDGCGCGMLVPADLLDISEVDDIEDCQSGWHDSDDDIPQSTSPPSASPKSPKESSRPRAQTMTPPPPAPALSPPSLNSDLRQFRSLLQNPPEGFGMCPVCKDVAFCSSDCLQDSLKNHHVIICSRDLEQWIRDSVLSHEIDGLPKPHEQRITLLLLLRLFATLSKYTRRHPIEHPWIQLLNIECRDPPKMQNSYGRAGLHQCFPDLYDTNNIPHKLEAKEAVQAASLLTPCPFETNVRKPFNMLMCIGGPKLAFDVARFDGWIINTILMKMERNTITTFGARFEKGFDDAGNLVSEQMLVRGTQADQLELKRDGESEMGQDYDPVRWRERQVWRGSLYPLSSLVRVAREGEKANVALYERGGTIVCRPIMGCREHRKDSAAKEEIDWGAYASWPLPIKAGDELIREAKIRFWECESDLGFEHPSSSDMELTFSETNTARSDEPPDVEMNG